MEAVRCRFQNSGFCKFRENCRARHVTTKCPVINSCSNKNCDHRHPRKGRNGVKCRFKSDCSYDHDTELSVEVNTAELTNKVAILNNKVKELFQMTVENQCEIDRLVSKTKQLEAEVRQKESSIEELEMAIKVKDYRIDALNAELALANRHTKSDKRRKKDIENERAPRTLSVTIEPNKGENTGCEELAGISDIEDDDELEEEVIEDQSNTGDGVEDCGEEVEDDMRRKNFTWKC